MVRILFAPQHFCWHRQLAHFNCWGAFSKAWTQARIYEHIQISTTASLSLWSLKVCFTSITISGMVLTQFVYTGENTRGLYADYNMSAGIYQYFIQQVYFYHTEKNLLFHQWRKLRCKFVILCGFIKKEFWIFWMSLFGGCDTNTGTILRYVRVSTVTWTGGA